MSKAPQQKDGLGGTLRNVLSRAAQTLGYPSRGSVNATDLNWDDEDFQQSKSESESFYDPWSQDKAPQEAEFRPATQSALSSSYQHQEGVSTGIHLEVAKPSTNKEGSLDVDEGEDRPSTEVGAGDNCGRLFETDEDWELLEEAEEDLIEAKAEIKGPATSARDDEPGEESRTRYFAPERADEIDAPCAASETSTSDDGAPLEDYWGTDSDRFETLSSFGFDGPTDSDGNEDLELFDFDEDAHQSPWEQEEDFEEEVADLRASAKAASIVGLLDLRSIGERQEALVFLRSLFEHLTSPATFQAIRRSAEEGLDLATLIDMVELRTIWMQRSEWWLMRYHSRIVQMRHGQSALSWPLARRVCLARSDHPVETMIDEEWLGEWLALPGGHPDFQYFTQFINEKVRHLDAENLHRGLRSQERNETAQELGNDFSWYRRVPDREGAIRLGFHFLTPYDERPGVIRPGIPIPGSDED